MAGKNIIEKDNVYNIIQQNCPALSIFLQRTFQCPDVNNECVTNPTPDLAGLMNILPKLSSLPANLLPSNLVNMWWNMIQQLPDLAMTEGPNPIILPAKKFPTKNSNTENTELYTVHPYNLFGVHRTTNISIAQNTFAVRRFPCNVGWCQDVLDAALLGLTKGILFSVKSPFVIQVSRIKNTIQYQFFHSLTLPSSEAQTMVSQRAAQVPPAGWRFPAFVGPFQDETPNEDHLSNMRTALQHMLIQNIDAGAIVLFPAWPSGEWNVEFKLLASKKTVIEGKCEDGKLKYLNVIPEERRKDIVFAGHC